MSVFTVDTDTNDVEEALCGVADGLRRWEGGEAPRLEVPVPLGTGGALAQQARQLRFQSNIDRDAIIHSTRPRLGPLLIRFQTVVRRLTWWFLEPVVQQVRLFQANAARVADGLAQGQESLSAQVDHLTRRVEALERELRATEDTK